MLARHRLLAARGWAVISVPSYVWNELDDAGRGAWLMQARSLRTSLTAFCLPASSVRAPSARDAFGEQILPHGLVRSAFCCVAWPGRAPGKHLWCALQAIRRARAAQAAAAALPPGAPRPLPSFAELAAMLAPQRMFEDAVSAQPAVRA